MLFDLHYKWSIEGMIDWLIDWSIDLPNQKIW